jgi:hypothetical protein
MPTVMRTLDAENLMQEIRESKAKQSKTKIRIKEGEKESEEEDNSLEPSPPNAKDHVLWYRNELTHLPWKTTPFCHTPRLLLHFPGAVLVIYYIFAIGFLPLHSPFILPSALLEKGEEIRVEDVHGPLSIPRINDARNVDLAGAW